MDPQSLTRRSPVYRKLQDRGAAFAEINGCMVAISTGEAEEEIETTRSLSLCDLSGLARLGIKGPGTTEWLTEQGSSVPPESNRTLRQDDGSLVAKLAPNEVLILSDLEHQSRLTQTLTSDWRQADDPPATARGFLLPRQDSHAWFLMAGREAPATLAKLCAVDLRPHSFDVLRVAQTSVARLNAIVLRDDLDGTPAYHLLADYASAEYWWECLLDAGAEHQIGVVGLDVLSKLKRS